MKLIAFLLGFLPMIASAALIHGKDSNNNDQVFRVNSSGQATIALLAGEDQTNNVMKVEHQYSYCLDDADIVCKASAGFVHTVVCWGEDGTAEAGSFAIRDATSAGSGTIVYGETIAAAAYTAKTITLDAVFATGIVIDWTTTTDVFCTVSYR